MRTYNFGSLSEDYDANILTAIRPDMLAAIERYVQYGIAGDFLSAVIDNNLREALGRADSDNRRALREIVQVFYNYCPGDCWGSRENRQQWQARGGLSGKEKI
jgi:hypothetical protein